MNSSSAGRGRETARSSCQPFPGANIHPLVRLLRAHRLRKSAVLRLSRRTAVSPPAITHEGLSQRNLSARLLERFRTHGSCYLLSVLGGNRAARTRNSSHPCRLAPRRSVNQRGRVARPCRLGYRHKNFVVGKPRSGVTSRPRLACMTWPATRGSGRRILLS